MMDMLRVGMYGIHSQCANYSKYLHVMWDYIYTATNAQQ